MSARTTAGKGSAQKSRTRVSTVVAARPREVGPVANRPTARRSAAALPAAEVERLAQELTAVTSRLLGSQAELERRAQRMELELESANRELEAKVVELDRLRVLDKMAAIGTLAAGIAHEIRNPLSAVQGYASLLLRSEGLDPKHRQWIERILRGSNDCAEIVTNLLVFASPDRLALEAIDPEELLRVACEMAVDPGKDPSRWTITRSCAAPRFAGDRLKLRQAVRNLVENALQVQPDGGHVDVALRLDGAHIEIAVQDAGPGVPPELREKVLEPFFTTRAEGTGLGLALVHTIARLHCGELVISSSRSPRGGADIRLRIPFHQAA
jgi:signal transduction histidine kinase